MPKLTQRPPGSRERGKPAERGYCPAVPQPFHPTSPQALTASLALQRASSELSIEQISARVRDRFPGEPAQRVWRRVAWTRGGTPQGQSAGAFLDAWQYRVEEATSESGPRATPRAIEQFVRLRHPWCLRASVCVGGLQLESTCRALVEETRRVGPVLADTLVRAEQIFERHGDAWTSLPPCTVVALLVRALSGGPSRGSGTQPPLTSAALFSDTAVRLAARSVVRRKLHGPVGARSLSNPPLSNPPLSNPPDLRPSSPVAASPSPGTPPRSPPVPLPEPLDSDAELNRYCRSPELFAFGFDFVSAS